MKARIVVTALAAVTAVGLAYMLGSGDNTPGTAGPDTPTEDGGFGYVARDVIVRQTDASGQLQYELVASQVDRRSDADPVVARDLTLQYEPLDAQGRVQQGRRWTVRAGEGRLPEATGLLELGGGVTVVAQLQGPQRPLTMRTDALTYHTREQTLHSTAEVVFQWGGQQLAGRGLSANIGAGTLALESNVHGRLSP